MSVVQRPSSASTSSPPSPSAINSGKVVADRRARRASAGQVRAAGAIRGRSVSYRAVPASAGDRSSGRGGPSSPFRRASSPSRIRLDRPDDPVLRDHNFHARSTFPATASRVRRRFSAGLVVTLSIQRWSVARSDCAWLTAPGRESPVAIPAYAFDPIGPCVTSPDLR